MADYVLDAVLREETGKGAARRLRRTGNVPAVLYGGNKPELPIAVNALALSKLLNDEGFYTSMLELKIKGSRGKHTALLKDVQWHPLRDEAVHLDFQRVSSSDSVHIEVPVHPVNHEKCPAAVAGGVLSLIRHSLEVTCRADSIPDTIEVDCAGLEIGDSVHIEDIPLPDGAEVPHEVNFTVLTFVAPTKAVETAAGAAEEGEAAGPAEASEGASE